MEKPKLSEVLKGKSTQITADDLIAGPVVIKITDVVITMGEQPVVIHYKGEDGRPFRPCLTMSRLLAFAWGDKYWEWQGRRIRLYRDAAVKFKAEKTGGVRIDGLSDIDAPITVALTERRGQKREVTVEPLPPEKVPSPDEILSAAAQKGIKALQAAWGRLSDALRQEMGGTCPDKYKQAAQAAEKELQVS